MKVDADLCDECQEFHGHLPCQADVLDWAVRNFGDASMPLVALGLAEEVGELARAIVKREEGIRGSHEEWTAELRKELGDCVIKLLNIAQREGIDLGAVTQERWALVSQRDFARDKRGHGIPVEAET